MSKTEKRKVGHIRICVEKNVQAREVKTGFEDVYLVHRALPEMSLEGVDVSTQFFGSKLSAPIVIEPMTGGTRKSAKINAVLAEAAEFLGLAMGVGSQRVAIENPRLAYTFQIVREKAPNAFLMANLGCPQLVEGFGVDEARRAVEMIEADALAFHLNPLQEAMQHEGEACYEGVLAKIREISAAVGVPIIAKETGAGIAAEEARALEGVGVRGIDVSGVGGTSWAAVEYYRAKEVGDELHKKLGFSFWDWGIPTAVSIVEVGRSTRFPVIASGGIRTGIEAAKAIALGAGAVGMALPLLKPALKGSKEVVAVLKSIIDELRVAMFLTGARAVKDLNFVPVIITGKTAEWLRVRGFEPEIYGRRARQ